MRVHVTEGESGAQQPEGVTALHCVRFIFHFFLIHIQTGLDNKKLVEKDVKSKHGEEQSICMSEHLFL